MNTTTFIRSLLVPAVVVLAVGGLSGCGVVEDVTSGSVTSTADTREALSGEIPAWIPVDATGITRVDGTRGDAVSILFQSSSDLDPSSCVAVPRVSAPTVQVEDAPDVYAEDQVFSCGDWAVVPATGGWYGWTPATESTAAPSPTTKD
ncbi:hypothetical protein ALI44B_00685 [Leifsonia sp. ALI-44-B]|jgi:hypothetical protein|uniref:hypothetical protein n=1 Tax=Leifsonia sp. ALI-44-B TaxID=1933776 RepID=UPI00097C6E6F|nr:hypothetical protein [Leifsonia sp. ALI-44-B]ONI65241.1 hypothetical protein ALI44B_00685 [Leifsonia sp. ALI-44-B]